MNARTIMLWRGSGCFSKCMHAIAGVRVRVCLARVCACAGVLVCVLQRRLRGPVGELPRVNGIWKRGDCIASRKMRDSRCKEALAVTL